MMSRPHATRDDWKHTPMPDTKAPVDLHRTFTAQDYHRLQAGLVPEEMEDKWFIYWENDELFFHRSWTGVCLFQVRFAHEGPMATIREAWVNRDPQQRMKGAAEANPSYEKAMLTFLIDHALLEQDAPVPVVDEASGSVRFIGAQRPENDGR